MSEHKAKWLESQLHSATDKSVRAEELEVKIALKLMCLRALILWPNAVHIRLDDDDQGDWATTDGVLDAAGNDLTEDLPYGYWDDGNEYASHLYDNRVYIWKPFLVEGTWGGERNPGVGVLDIQKTLDGLGNLP